MKKIIIGLVLFSMTAGLVSPVISNAETTESPIQKAMLSNEKEFQQLQEQAESQTQAQTLQSFIEMQDKITATLKIENNHYVYDEATIREIVNSFDFAALAESTDSDFTSENFANDAIESIKNTDLTPQKNLRQGNQYNVNKTENGWNYTRVFSDTARTKQGIRDFKKVKADSGFVGGTGAAIAALAGLAASTGPFAPFVGGLGAIVCIETLALDRFYGNVIDDLEYCNTGYGTVLDMNKFIPIHSCYTQPEYARL